MLVDELKCGLDGREQQWLVKSESQVLRLAATLTCLNWATPRDVPSRATGLDMISAAMEPDEVTQGLRGRDEKDCKVVLIVAS
jgi:hypothetical protein